MRLTAKSDLKDDYQIPGDNEIRRDSRQALACTERCASGRVSSNMHDPDQPPVKEPPNEPRLPPVEEPGPPPEPPPDPGQPPVEEPPNEPKLPPIKEPPPEDPDLEPA